MHHFSNTQPLKILVIEDNFGDYLLLKENIESSAIQLLSIEVVDRLESAKEYLGHNKPDIIFLDLYLPDSTGLGSYNQLKNYINGSPVIILSGISDTRVAQEAIANGAQDYLAKGEFDEKLLEKTVIYAIERVRNLEALRIANERYNLVAKATRDLVWDWDLITGMVYRDEQSVKKVYGINNNESIRNFDDWNKRIHPDDANHISFLIEKMKRSTSCNFYEVEYRFRTDAGDYKYIYDRCYVVRDKARKALRLIGAAQDITEKKKLEKALLEAKLRQQREIAEATIKGQENERSQLGMELHDNITQILATSKLYLENKFTGTRQREMIEKSKELIVLATQELRKLSHALLPPTLQDSGFKQSLHELTATIESTGLFNIEKNWDSFDEKLLSEDQQLTIYRIIQEQLNNIIKHAGAANVLISLDLRDGAAIELLIKDDGRGFDAGQKKNGVGLRNIITRAELYDGHVSISSYPGRGCELKVIFPAMEAVSLNEYVLTSNLTRDSGEKDEKRAA
jgi:two-component system sensor histidine kinase UhpB